MTIQTGNLGTAPSGAGGDTFRSFATKVNENFTNNTHAASRMVGTAAGNLMEVGAFGVGIRLLLEDGTVFRDGRYTTRNGLISGAPTNATAGYVDVKVIPSSSWAVMHWQNITNGRHYFKLRDAANNSGAWQEYRTTFNTTIDANGFIKNASPIIKLFADKIEANEEALEQEPIFEKVDVGHYLLKNTEGFSDDGWYIEMPKDANGNVLVAVQYQQLEDNTIEVKTYTKKFDEETGDIVPNLEKPRDIPADRWIDIRLKELLKPEIEISNTPLEFQPTNLAQAVAEALKDDSEQ